MSVRIVTKEQVADGTTVDGDRLERAMASLLSLFNRVPKKHLARRHMQSQFVSGFTPDVTGATRLPFMWTLNDATTTTGTTPDSYAAPQRMKGIYQSDALAKQYAWTQTFYFKRPVVIVQADWFLLRDSTYDNDFVYGSPLPSGKSAGASVDDVSVLVTVDSPWKPEDPEFNSVELARHRFLAESEEFTNLAVPAHTDMAPAFPGGNIDGLNIILRDVNIPIHRDARVRFSLVLPRWSNDEPPWGATPWAEQAYSGCLTILEEVEEG